MSEYDRKDYLMRWGLHSVRGLRCIITHSAKCCSCLPHRLHIYKMCFLKLLISTALLFTLPKWKFIVCLFPKYMCSASPQQPTMFGRFALGWPKFGWFALGWPEGKKAGGRRAHIGEAVVGQTVHLLWTPCPSPLYANQDIFGSVFTSSLHSVLVLWNSAKHQYSHSTKKICTTSFPPLLCGLHLLTSALGRVTM